MIDVRSQGAMGDGISLDTASIQKALDACNKQGGGEVYFPAGRYLTGTLVVGNNTTLNISSGATILGSPRMDDYVLDSRGRSGDQTGYHLISIRDAHHVRITGGGTIDGQGPVFWDTPENPVDGKFPWRKYHLALSPHDERPSPMVNIARSSDIRIEDVTLTNSAGWALNMALSRWIWVRGVKILNSMIGPNSDGIDIQACQDVMIDSCHIETGDDAIVMFTLPGSASCERIAISNCILSTRCCAVKFYSGSRYPFRQVTANNIVVYNTERAFGTYLFNGARLEDITCSNFVVQGGTTPPNFSERPIHIDIRNPFAYWEDRDSYLKAPHAMHPDSEIEPDQAEREFLKKFGSLSGLTLSNWTIRSRGRIIVGGQSSAPVTNLVMDNIQLFSTGDQDLTKFIQPTPSTGQWNHDLPKVRTTPAHMILHGVNNAHLKNLRIAPASPLPLGRWHGIWLEQVHNVRLENLDCYPLAPGMDEIHKVE